MKDAHRIAAFIEAQAAELDAAQNTQSAYARDLVAFSDWIAGQGTPMLDATQTDIESFLIALEAQGLAASTRARRLSAIKQFFRFAFEEAWRGDNPAIRIKGPGRSKRLPKTLSEADVTALIDRNLESSRQMADITELLASQADRLVQSINRFKLQSETRSMPPDVVHTGETHA